MRILLTGATGLIGRPLSQALQNLGHQLTVLTRDSARAQQRLGSQIRLWSSLSHLEHLNDFDAVINLAGEPIADKRWSSAQKQRLCHSRWGLTERLSRLINASSEPPATFISGSAVGYYGNQGQGIVTEDESPRPGFTQHLCQHWEELALEAASPRTRVCLLRTGVVLSPEGGALAKMTPAYRLGLGGPLGNGQQYLSWIHIDDTVNAIIFLLTHPTLQGPVNLVSPYPVHNAQFSALLAEVLDRPAFMRMPGWVLRLLMGEAAVLLLTGQRALPHKLLNSGFNFEFVELEQALQNVLQK